VHPALAAEPAFVEELVLVTHPSTRRLGDASVLRGATLVAFGDGCAYRRSIDRWLGARGVRPPKVFEVSSYHAMLACVAANVGYAVAPRSVLAVSNAAAAIRVHKVSNPPLRITTSFVRHRADRSRAVQALGQIVASSRSMSVARAAVP
jgi:DNA-binding transcriptional LysR family regulator